MTPISTSLLLATLTLLLTADAASCTQRLGNHTCLIQRNASHNTSAETLLCDAALPQCHVQCHGAASCRHTSITCPSTLTHCTVDCAAVESCAGASILSAANSTSIHIRGADAGHRMDIHSTHTLYVDVFGVDADFYDSHITGTLDSDMHVDCDEARLCRNNTIDAYKSQSLSVACADTDCAQSTLTCPAQRGLCSVECGGASCRDMRVLAQRGQSVVDWRCQSTEAACLSSQLVCGNRSAEWWWDGSRWTLDVEAEGCVVDAAEPSAQPTLEPTAGTQILIFLNLKILILKNLKS